MDLPDRVEIVEVGPRDGLQAEDAVLTPAERADLVRRLVRTGVSRIEVASFVHPRRVPQMAGAEEVVAAIGPRGFSAIGLVLNRKGLDRALTTDVDEINFSIAASDGYGRSNQGSSVAEAIEDLEASIPVVLTAERRVTVTISVAFGDPYDGEVPVERVAALASRIAAAGAHEIAVGDTIGVAVPTQVEEMLVALRDAAPAVKLRCHFHNTRDTALANVLAALESGVDALDASVGGIGGSPFAPEAGGNVATEDVLWMLDRMGIETGIDRSGVLAVSDMLANRLGRRLPAAGARAGTFPST